VPEEKQRLESKEWKNERLALTRDAQMRELQQVHHASDHS
jgi:hypothetical protein